MQPCRLHGERLQEIDAMQCRQHGRLARCGTGHLEVASGREDNAALDDVVSNEAVERAGSRRADDLGAI